MADQDGERVALVAGASGLVGGALVRQLVSDASYARTVALTRRPLGDLPAAVAQEVVDFDALDAVPAADDVFITLGTTIKKAGSQEAFARVDHDMVIAVARTARAAGASRLFVVTAMGADASSSIFYNRVKGQVEADLRGLDYPTTWIFRPSLITGDRPESRAGEAVASFFMAGLKHVMVGGLRKYRPIAGETIARAMRAAAHETRPGFHVLLSDEIERRGAAV